MPDHDPQCLVARYPVVYDTDPFPWCTCHGRRLAMIEFTDTAPEEEVTGWAG